MSRVPTLMLTWLVVMAAAGCTNNRKIDDTHRMIQHYFPLELTETVTTKSAACEAGEVLLGAGHRVDRVSLDLNNAVAVRVNRPDGANGWRLTVVRGPTTPAGAVSVSLYLYCLRRSDGDPITLTGQTIAGAEVTLTDPGSGVATADTSAACASGQTLTGGGFDVSLGTADPTNTAAAYNSWIWSSRPTTARTAWRVDSAYINRGGAMPRVRAYARCVRDPDSVLRPVTVADAAATRASGFNFDFYTGSANCGTEAFAASGGFAFSGDKLIPHSILKDQITPEFAGWTVRGVYGLQTGSSAALTVRPLCFEGLAIEKPDQIDLVPMIGANPFSGSGLVFTVLNAGTAAAPASVVEVVGATTVRSAVPALAPGESTELTVSVEPLCTNDCSARVTVDPDRTIAESNETNNIARWSGVG